MIRELILRQQEPRDNDAVAAILDAAFLVPPGASSSVEARLAEQLRSDGDVIEPLTIVADRHGEIVGTVMCSRGMIGEVPAVGLGPIAVPPALQRKGIGAALMSSVIVTADQLREPAIVLLGDPAYYEEFWFEPAVNHGISSGQPWPDENFMVRILQAWKPEMAGRFRYATAFEGL